MKELETRKITIDEEYSDGQELGVDAIAFTKKPAIIVKGVAFSAQDEPSVMKFSDNKKMRIASPIMIPGSIYRNDGDEEYYVEFTVETIEAIYKKFMSNLTGKPIFNKEHNSKDIIPAYVLEPMLVDSENKVKFIKDEYGIDLPIGSVFVVSQVTDEAYYNYLVKNDMLGFSIEGFLGLEFSEQIKNQNKNKNKTEMEKSKFMLPDGEWTMDGKIYIIKDGEIAEIKEPEVKEEEVTLEAEPKVEEEVKEEVNLEAEPKVEEEVKEEEEVKLQDEPMAEPTVEPSMEETIIKVVDERIEVLINEIADLKSQLLAMKNEEKLEDRMEFKADIKPYEKALGLFKFVSNK